MTRLDLKLGFACNNDCRFCVQGPAKRLRYGDRTTEEVKRLLAEGRAHCDGVVLTGGEITVRRDLPEIVEYARTLGYRTIQLQTNGRILGSMAAAQRLKDAGATEVSPALHGPTAEIHDGLTRSPGAFRQTVRGIRNARRLDLPVIINSVITRDNHRHLPALARLLVALDVQQFQLAFVHPLGAAEDNFDDIVPRLPAVEPYVRAALAIGRRAGVRCMTEAIPLCFLRGIEHFAAEWIIPDTRIEDAAWTIEDYTETRRTQGKAKGPPCKGCRWEQECEGPWREYPERFGWDEFQPVAPTR